MALDGIVLQALCNRLQDLIPARINRIHEVSDTEVLFHIRHHGKNETLLISAHSSYNRIHLTNRKYPTPETPSNFIMNLRKHLLSGTITSIKQTDLDRCLEFTIRNANEMGDLVDYRLYGEFMGKYANIILVSPEDKILHALKLIPPYETNKRIIQIGASFALTDPIPNKVNPFEHPEIDDARTLTDQFHGFSPLLEKEIRHRMAKGESFSTLLKELQESKTLYVYPGKNTSVFHILPLTHLNQEGTSYPLFEGFDAVYYSLEEKDRIRQQTGDLYKLTRKEIKKLNAKLIKLKDSLEEANNSGPWKEKGQLLYANLDKVHKGMSEIQLESFETGELIPIPLDPKLDGKGNAKKCFQKYTKGRNGQVYIQEQINKAEMELEYFQNLEYQLEEANFMDATEIQQDLIQQGYLHPKKLPSLRKTKKPKEPNITSFDTSDGGQILYGTNNLQNEYLTWKKAHKEDLWFHVKDAPGSHVVLRKKNPTEKEIRLAAMTAAYHSASKDSSSIPVNWCNVSQLKKIPGGKSGLVQLGSYKTIYIDIDPKILEDDPNGPLKKGD